MKMSLDPERPRKQKEYKKNWYLQMKKERPDYYIKRLYGISKEDWQTLFDKQHGCCAICGKHQVEFSKALHVDHCHITLKVRGLLCSTCNTQLGIYEKHKSKFEEYLICHTTL